MQIVEHTVWLLVGIGALASGYGLFVLVRTWWDKRPRSATVRDLFLNAHIVTQWTEGRLRLESLLALLRALEHSLEQDVRGMQHPDSSGFRSDSDGSDKAGPVLRRFTFDTHLRNECRVLIPLLQFCATDLMALQGKDMTQKLDVLAQIQAALESAGPH